MWGPGQAPEGSGGVEGDAGTGAARLSWMAQFRRRALFLEEEHNRASGREEAREGWRREGEAEKNVVGTGEDGQKKGTGTNRQEQGEPKAHTGTQGRQSRSGKERGWERETGRAHIASGPDNASDNALTA